MRRDHDLTSRRDFLRSIMAGAVAMVVVPGLSVAMPISDKLTTLVGDGITDDGPAIQALIDRQALLDRGRGVYLPQRSNGSSYFVGQALVVGD